VSSISSGLAETDPVRLAAQRLWSTGRRPIDLSPAILADLLAAVADFADDETHLVIEYDDGSEECAEECTACIAASAARTLAQQVLDQIRTTISSVTLPKRVGSRRWTVRWREDGRRRTRTVDTRAEAEWFYSDLRREALTGGAQ
jgi:hypothetical protein